MALKRARRGVSEMVEEEPEVQDTAPQEEKSGGAGKMIVTILIVIIILAGGWYLIDNYTGINLPGGNGSSVMEGGSEWSAVFLSNGQVYFGKIKNIDDRDLTLTDIYYLQVVNQPLQRSQEGEEADAQQQTRQELKMMKLGNELHGPTDLMNINRDHILLTESLKEDSTVVKSIREYVAAQENPQE